ncbi:MAG: DUF4091 domain-containing protein [Victivallales bacterium]|nr:DUF4091 domain-containing protein [Victivallales bacterium]
MLSCRICLVAMLASALAYANELINPNLEVDADGNLYGWASYRPDNPLKIVKDDVQDGKSAVYGEISKEKPAFGIVQVLTYDKPDKRPVTFGGWSKCEGVNSSRDYCIYLDIFFEDGTNDWAKCSYWPTGTHDWEYTVECYWPPKNIAKIEYYVLLRHTTGKAWFDNFELTREDPGARMRVIEVQSTAPFPPNGVQINSSFFHSGTTYTARIVDKIGKILAEKSDRGHIVNWTLELPDGAAKVIIDGMKSGAAPFRNERVINNVHPKIKENPVTGAYRVWTADSMRNISPLMYPAADEAKDVFLELAKAERESAQILVTAGAKKIDAVNVELPVLKNAAGEALKGELKWERVGYIPRNVPHVLSPESGYDPSEFWLPDPLLPPREFMVPANATQGVWLTVHADREAVAGDYSGIINIVIGTEKIAVPIRVTVFDFALPKTFSYPTAFCLMDGFLFRTYGDGDRNETRRKAWDIMLDHRLNPDDISRTTPPRIEDLLYARERGMNRFNILNLVPQPKPDFKGLWVCFSSTNVYTDELFEEFKRRLDPYVAELRKHDLTKYAYAYGFDERGEEYNAIMARVHKLFKERYPDVAFFTTSKMYVDLKKDPTRTDCYANDWYCPLTSVYDMEFSDKLREKGHQVWWYTCCGPKHPYANMATTEYPFIEGRLLAWMSYLYKADGFLYWHVNMWQNAKRFDESNCYQPDFGVLQVVSMSGDGQFLYPGEKGPLPSIRFANIRDGSEDYDYLAMCGESSRAECSELIKSMTEYSRDSNQLREMRRRIAKRIIGK